MEHMILGMLLYTYSKFLKIMDLNNGQILHQQLGLSSLTKPTKLICQIFCF